MATLGLVGLPGHGKSYSAVEIFILPALAQGRTIYTNIPLHDEQIKARYPDADIRPFDLEVAAKSTNFGADMEPGFLAVFDELWRIWPSGLKTSDIPIDQLSFIKEHRHRIGEDGKEPDIVLVTQDLSDIAASIRQMVETTIICSKLLSLGAKNTFRRDYYRGAIKGQTGPKNAFARADHGCKYRAEVYSLYKSHTKGESSAGQVDNSGTVSISIFKSTGFLIGGVVAVLLVIGIFYGVSVTKSGIDDVTKTKTNSVVEKTGTIQTPVVEPSKPVAPSPQYSEKYRLVGNVQIPGKTIYMISDGKQTIKLSNNDCLKSFKTAFIECRWHGQIITSFTGYHENEPDIMKPETLVLSQASKI